MRIDETGFYSTTIDITGTEIQFNLHSEATGHYVMCFCTYDTSLTINGVAMTSHIYRIDKEGETKSIILKTSQKSNFSFAISQIPNEYERLDYFPRPINKNYINIHYPEAYYLVVYNDDFLQVAITDSCKDCKDIYYSTTGNIFDAQSDLSYIPKTKIIIIIFMKPGLQPERQVNIKIETDSNLREDFIYYDSSAKGLFGRYPISIPILNAKDDYRIPYENSSYAISSTNPLTFYIPSNTTIVFTKSINVSGKVKTSYASLDILGESNIRAIEFRAKGTLVISTNQSIAYCDLVAFNFSTNGCSRSIIISGIQYYFISLNKTDKTYCTLNIPINQYSAIKSSNYAKYSTMSANGGPPLFYPINYPTITKYYTKSKTKRKIIFINGEMSPYSCIIDGMYSSYSFYNISDTTFNRINNYPAVGSVIGDFNFIDEDTNLSAIVVWIIVISIIIIIGVVSCVLFYILFIQRKRLANKSMELQSSLLNPAQDPYQQ